MNRPSSFLSFAPGAKRARSKPKSAAGVADYLRADDKLAALLPAVARLGALQKLCATILPALFETCSVMHFDAGQLVLATPNAAMATKLKQQLPKLQDALRQQGWQVNAIRIKVQVRKIAVKSTTSKHLVLPGQALSALAELNDSLENSPRNEALKAAIRTMLRRHKNQS
jgi:hypothetical protein